MLSSCPELGRICVFGSSLRTHYDFVVFSFIKGNAFHVNHWFGGKLENTLLMVCVYSLIVPVPLLFF